MKRLKVRAKELRKMKTDELISMLSDTDKEIMKFRAVARSGGEGIISLPTGRKQGIKWGVYQTLKKNRAIILTVMTENKKEGIRC